MRQGDNLEIVYFAYDGIITQSVFDSQVVTFLEYMSKNYRWKINLIAFERFPDFFIQIKRLEEKKRYLRGFLSGKILFLPRVPGFTGVKISQILIFLICLFKSLKREKIIVHARGNKAAYIACKLKKLLPSMGVLYDARGAEPEEFIYGLQLQKPELNELEKNRGKEYEFIKEIERFVINNSDRISCVSNELKKHFKKKYEINGTKFTVIPGGVDTSKFHFDKTLRNRMREKLSVDGKLVFIYSGSIGPHQLPVETIRLFKDIYNNDNDTFLLFVTLEKDKAEQLIIQEAVPRENYLVTTATYKNIPSYLNAADVGIILRERSVVNGVASPIKFAEYIATGLSVIVTESLIEASKILDRRNIGFIIKDLKNDKERKAIIRNILEEKANILSFEYKNNISKIGEKAYSWNKLNPNIVESYNSILNG